MALLCLQNGGNSPSKKHSITSLIHILNFQKNWIRFIMISNVELKKFQINFMLKLFVFNVGIIGIILKLLFIKNNLFSFKFFNSMF
jgi:hypothetical protein